ncbi:SusC/RagA family TonB-linked outer membrane protein [Allomuricauda sp. F6463D]|uniref:SusC/RagA family TonB-linked outer membrane protein n=1 Tax=Allomuricauda sp. F6463D TaxID=2926409 RepID=UPI001FF25EB9|nr:SusC/RagA family TonB-linked outer membrane protein [Muricauda sp. F6463D]MCK0160490.1 SusC/RagA family TonB-linked outer membrane protein [Muricauda sp. F6463D]
MQLATIRMRRFFLSVLLYVFLTPLFSFNVQAGTVLEPPQATITGTVTDMSGKPLAGVNIVVESKNIGAMSELNGSFSIHAGSSDVLVFSMVGYKTLSVPIGGREELFVALEEDVTVLGEVVLNAGYYTVSEREGTGTIEKVSAVEIEKQPLSNPLAALQGRVAGVEINQFSGLPGSNFNIQIRGRNSIRPGANEPLYVIDGVPFASGSLGEEQASLPLPGGAISPLNNINPSDIESIEILKDADATAIYGSRGANGVVLITTKKGTSGDTKVELHVQTGLGSVTRKLDLLNTAEYLMMRKEAYANDGIDPFPSNAYDVNGTWYPNRQTDWQKALFGRTSYLTDVRGSISGGNASTQFLVSGNYYSQSSVFPGNFSNNKVSVLSNLGHRTKDNRFSVQLSTSFTSNTNDLPGDGLLVFQALQLAPNAPALYTEEGELNWEGSTWRNPLGALNGVYVSKGTTLISNVRLTYKLWGELSLTTNLGYTENHLRELNTVPSTIYDPAYGIGPESSYAVHNTGERSSWTIEPQLQYQRFFGGLRLTALGGLTFQNQETKRRSQFAFGFTNNSLIENLSAASELYPVADITEQYRYQAFYGRINLSLHERYFVNLTGRRDGSSRFGPDKRYANFTAIGAAWLFGSESFVKEGLPFVSYGKLRGSYGTSGNDKIGEYQYLDTYSFGSQQYQNTIGLYPTRLFNPNFSWEENKKLELALELGLFQDRILLNTNYYRNRSTNQLVGIPLPATTGFSSVNANLGATVENRGWELELLAHLIRKEKFSWTMGLNMTFPKNELLEFPNLEGSTYVNQYVVGKPLNIAKVYQWNGVDSQTGLYTFEDFNGDGAIASPDDRQLVKELDPSYYGGLTSNLGIGKFTMDLLFQFSKQEGYNFWATGGVLVGRLGNQPKSVLQRWQEGGDMAPVQRFSTGTSQTTQAFRNYGRSDAAISDASFLRLRTVSLSYRLTDRKVQGFGCELFLRGQNLFTITGFEGLDPETQSNQAVPPLRMVSLGTKLTF